MGYKLQTTLTMCGPSQVLPYHIIHLLEHKGIINHHLREYCKVGPLPVITGFMVS